MVDEFIRQARLVVPNQRNAVFPGNIFRGNDHEFIPVNSRSERDLVDTPAGNLAANRRSEEHVWQSHVVDVLRPSGDLVPPLLTRNGLADDAVDDPVAIHLWTCGKPGPADGIV